LQHPTSYFNILSLALCLTTLDTTTPGPLDAGAWALVRGAPLLSAWCAAVLGVGGMLAFPWANGLTLSWPYFPVFSAQRVRSPAAQAVLGFFRALAPFRVVHGYGVFPPHTGPSVKLVPVLEGRRRLEGGRRNGDGDGDGDGDGGGDGGWHEYEWRHMIGDVRRAPPFVSAPASLHLSAVLRRLGHRARELGRGTLPVW